MNRSTSPCFSCRYFAGLNDDERSGMCVRPDDFHAIPHPERGCVHYDADPEANTDIRTCSDWILRYGMPIKGFTDNRKPFRAAMPPGKIRAAWARNKSDEVFLLAWEIARLRDIIERTIAALEVLARLAVPEYWRRYLHRIIKLLKIELGSDK